MTSEELLRITANFSKEVTLDGLDSSFLIVVAESLSGTFIGLQNPLIEYKTRSNNLILTLG